MIMIILLWRWNVGFADGCAVLASLEMTAATVKEKEQLAAAAPPLKRPLSSCRPVISSEARNPTFQRQNRIIIII